MTLGKILKIFRIASEESLSVNELARRLSISHTHILRLESDIKKPSNRILDELSKMYGVPKSEFEKVHLVSESKNLNYQQTLIEVCNCLLKNKKS